MTNPMAAFEFAARRFEPQGAVPYAYNPVGFVHDWIKFDPAPYQEAVLRDLCEFRRLAVRAPHGTGKTTTAALAVLWFIATREAMGVDWKVVTTAGAWRQLEKYLWPEIHKWVFTVDWAKLNMIIPRRHRELMSMSYRGKTGEAFAVASSDPALVEGAHADSILLIYDESKSIVPAIFDATEGIFSGAKPAGKGYPEAFVLAISTPGAPQGRFFDIHARKPGLHDWKVRHITLDEAMAAGRVSSEWVEARRLQWGESSALFANRVLGEFHSGSEQTVIPLAWIEEANQRWQDWDDAGRPLPEGTKVWGLDVALGGADLTCLAQRQAHIVLNFETINLGDTTKIAQWAAHKMRHQTDMVTVDVIGVGAGVADLLSLPIDGLPIGGYGKHVIRFKASRKSRRKDRSGEFGFVNQRAALWWAMREILDPAFGPDLALPPDDDLIGELTAPVWWETAQGLIAVEPKETIIKRIGHSTDRADAVLQTLATDNEWDSSVKDDRPTHTPYETTEWYDDERDGVFRYE